MVKVTSIYLLSRVVDSDGNPVDYKDVYKILWKLQDQTRKIKNKTIQLCWEWSNFSSDYIKIIGKSTPKDKELFGKNLENHINEEMKDFSILNTLYVYKCNARYWT